MKLEVRKDYITERRSVIAESRKFRPSDLHKQTPNPSSDPSKCPFCPGNEHMTPPEISRYGGRNWKVRVFRNKYPAFFPDAKNVRSKGMLVKERALGDHEVIVDTHDHFTELEHHPARHVDIAFKAFEDRIRDLAKDYLYVHWIKNRGKEGGASISHSHAQIFAFDYIPEKVAVEFGLAKEHFENTGRNIFDEIIETEVSGPRFVYENPEVVVVSPFAPNIDFEVMFISKKKGFPRYAYIADAFRTVVSAMDEILGTFPYTAYMRFPVFGDKVMDSYYRWNMRILPRVHKWAGFELGTGDIIITVPPEDWAKALRNHI